MAILKIAQFGQRNYDCLYNIWYEVSLKQHVHKIILNAIRGN